MVASLADFARWVTLLLFAIATCIKAYGTYDSWQDMQAVRDDRREGVRIAAQTMFRGSVSLTAQSLILFIVELVRVASGIIINDSASLLVSGLLMILAIVLVANSLILNKARRRLAQKEKSDSRPL